MSGHSKWSTIKRKKGANDAKRGKIFTKLIKEITVAAKMGGGDPDANPRLRTAILSAKSENMPKDNIERAIKKGTGDVGGAVYEEILYEGYAPHGVAVLVECATDNPTRTVASVRNAFNRNGGNFGTTGSVAFQFTRMGVFRLDPEGIDQDELELYLIDHGLEEMGESTGDEGQPQLVARCSFENFGEMQQALEDREITPVSAELDFICLTPTELPEEQAAEVLEVIDKLEQDEDVQKVYHTLA